MKKIYNKFLIISTISLFIGGVYLYFSNNLNSDTILPVAVGSSLDSSNDVNSDDSKEEDVSSLKKVNSDISFIKTLSSLKKIKIDTELFGDLNFSSLKDNRVNIGKVEAGRLNPFAPIQLN